MNTIQRVIPETKQPVLSSGPVVLFQEFFFFFSTFLICISASNPCYAKDKDCLKEQNANGVKARKIDVVDHVSREKVNFKKDFSHVNSQGVHTDFEGTDCIHNIPWLSTKRLSEDYSGIISTEQKRHGRQSLRIELRPCDQVSEGWRAEVWDKNHALPGSEVWYAISTYLPEKMVSEGVEYENFPLNDPVFGGGSANKYVFHQFHDQKVLSKEGQRESSPPLALRYKKNRLFLTLMNGAIYQSYVDQNTDGYGVIIWKSPKGKKLKNRWLDFVYQIRWSHDNQEKNNKDPGFLRVWLDDELVVECKGDIGFTDKIGVYFKYGIYAKRSVSKPRLAYHDSYYRAVMTKDSSGMTAEIIKLLQDNVGKPLPPLIKSLSVDKDTPLRIRCLPDLQELN